MRATTVSTILSFSAVAFGQDLSGLPSCAQTAALGAASSTGCTPTDVACLCQNFNGFQGAIQAGCTSASDRQAACVWGNSACAAYGVSIPCDDANSPDTNTDAGTPSDTTTADPPAPTDTAAPTGMDLDPEVVGPTATDSGISMVSGSPTDAMRGSTTGTGSGTDMGSMTLSMTTSMMTSGVTNGTIASHTSGNMTYSATMSTSATGSGPTSMYTGAASEAVRRGEMFWAVMGFAAVLALF